MSSVFSLLKVFQPHFSLDITWCSILVWIVLCRILELLGFLLIRLVVSDIEYLISESGKPRQLDAILIIILDQIRSAADNIHLAWFVSKTRLTLTKIQCRITLIRRKSTELVLSARNVLRVVLHPAHLIRMFADKIVFYVIIIRCRLI